MMVFRHAKNVQKTTISGSMGDNFSHSMGDNSSHDTGGNSTTNLFSEIRDPCKKYKKNKPYINSQNHIFLKIYYEVISG
jgi:hypothetical protein